MRCLAALAMILCAASGSGAGLADDYAVIAMVHDIPPQPELVADFPNGSSETRRCVVIDVLESKPHLLGGYRLKLWYPSSSPPKVNGRDLRVGDRLGFTIRQGTTSFEALDWQALKDQRLVP